MPNASAGDIIKKAKALGLKLTANHVYAVRAIDKRRGKPARLGSSAGAADQAGNGRLPNKRQSKTAFIRGFARDMPAAKVVEEAKRAGVKISTAYVYRVRALATPATEALKPIRRGAGELGGARRDPRSEQRLTTLALEIGLLRATILLDHVRARLGQ
ncbi:MAG: hypothetical protein RL701_3132 [Pseudomonadota bacterium]|jgi:hypothetical protein